MTGIWNIRSSSLIFIKTNKVDVNRNELLCICKFITITSSCDYLFWKYYLKKYIKCTYVETDCKTWLYGFHFLPGFAFYTITWRANNITWHLIFECLKMLRLWMLWYLFVNEISMCWTIRYKRRTLIVDWFLVRIFTCHFYILYKSLLSLDNFKDVMQQALIIS